MDKLARYLNARQAAQCLGELGATLGTEEYAVVRNIDYVCAPYEIYPLAPRVRPPLPRIAAFAVDMDGTSTTTEPLALHALEYMVRRYTGLLSRADWPGLDHTLDYPFIIGNSNYRHAEFLLDRYRERLRREAFRDAFFEALLWTLASMTDEQRRRDVTRNARNCGLADLLADSEFQRLIAAGPIEPPRAAELVKPLLRRFGDTFRFNLGGETVAAMLDIYYMRYHAIMQRIARGEGQELSQELLGVPGRLLIEPMPGYEVFVPLVKGWLGDEAANLYELLRDSGGREALSREAGPKATRRDIGRDGLRRLGAHFAAHPCKLALVTASIAFETHTTMREVRRVMALRVADWPVSAACKDRVLAGLADERSAFDGFVNASDACEHRLKPHRDLYSLALAQMAISRDEYACCVGLEDTEPGIIALRAAGIGCAVAMPNHDTTNQNYEAAALVVHGGLPELVLGRNCLLAEAPS